MSNSPGSLTRPYLETISHSVSSLFSSSTAHFWDPILPLDV